MVYIVFDLLILKLLRLPWGKFFTAKKVCHICSVQTQIQVPAMS